MSFFTIEQIKEANRKAGQHWFSPDSMRFFKSRISEEVFTLPDGTALFVSSEKEPHGARRFTIRKAELSGDISTVGEFQRFKSLSGAKYRAKKLQQEAKD